MKKILANALTLVAAFVMTLSASAIALEAVENAPVGEAKNAELSAVTDVAALGDFPELRDGAGKVIAYFKGDDTNLDYYAEAFNVSSPSDAWISIGNTSILQATTIDGENVSKVAGDYYMLAWSSENNVWLRNNKQGYGKYFTAVDIYIPQETTVSENNLLGRYDFDESAQDGYYRSGDQYNDDYFNSHKGEWIPFITPAVTTSSTNQPVYCGVASTSDDTKVIYLHLSTDNGYYVKNTALYYYPAGSFMTKDATGVLTLHENVTEHTFATDASNPGFVWTDGESSYAQGANVAISNLEYKTFELKEGSLEAPDAFEIYKEGLGKAVYHFDGSDVTNAVVDTASFLPVNPTLSNEIPGGAAITSVADPAGTSGKVLKIPAASDNNPEHISVSVADQGAYNYFWIHAKAGKFYMTADILIPSTSSVVADNDHLAAFAHAHGTGGLTNEDQKYLNSYKDTWQTYVSPALVADAVEGTNNVHYRGQDYSSPALTKLYYSLDTDNGHYMKNIALYYYPANSFFLNGTMITATEANYTLPTTCIDETGKIYQAGVTAVSELEYHTLKTASETLDLNQIRFAKTTDEKQVTGMRFAALIDLSTHDAADEYGFIVTGKDILEAGSVTDIQSFTKDSGVKYLIGAAYNKADGTEVIYDRDGSRGLAENGKNYAITAIINGITPKLYDTQFVVRPYIMVNGTTYYGTAKAQSYRAVARAIATGGYVGYDDNKDDIDAIINNTEANA